MKKRIALSLSFLLIFALTACGAGSGGSSTATGDAPSYYNSNADIDSTGIAHDDEFFSISVDSSIYSDPDAKVIRTAELTIQTTDFDQSTANLAALTEEQGGYYESAQVDGGGYYDQYANRTASYIVRIPKENFTVFRDKVGEVGHLYSIQENSKDVGEEYYDTEARLATLETKRERLLVLLDKAELMEDIISLENALADVQYEIDMHNTTLRKYDSLIDYSTFTIYLEEVVKISQEPTPEDGFFTRLGVSFHDGFEGFLNGVQHLAFWLARNIIVLVILAVIIMVVVKLSRKHYKKRHSISPEDK